MLVFDKGREKKRDELAEQEAAQGLRERIRSRSHDRKRLEPAVREGVVPVSCFPPE